MGKSSKSTVSSSLTISLVNALFGVIFLILGILNVELVDPVPGVLYILLALAYLLPADSFLKKKLGSTTPLAAKIIFGFIVLWGTLAVGDLAEMWGL